MDHLACVNNNVLLSMATNTLLPTHLSTLHLSHYFMADPCHMVTTTSHACDITDSLCTTLPQFTNLRELSLFANDYVTDRLIALISRHCPYLHTLNLGKTYSCADYTPVAQLRRLEHLDLSYNSFVDEQTLLSICDGCRLIRSFIVQCCPVNVDMIRNVCTQTGNTQMVFHIY
jgi:hypothetical protein